MIKYDDEQKMEGKTASSNTDRRDRRGMGQFDLFARMQMNANIGQSAEVETFIENASEAIEAAGRKGFEILKFDKETFSFLEYSNIVYAKESEGVCHYFIVQLAGTGIPSQTPAAILAYTNNENVYNQDRSILVLPGRAIEENLSTAIEDAIRIQRGIEKFNNCGGLIVHANMDLTSVDVAVTATAEAVNSVDNTIELITDGYSDSYLYDALVAVDTRQVTLSTVTESPEFLGDIRYTNFVTTLTAKNNKGKIAINKSGSEIRLSDTYGNVSISVVEQTENVIGPNNTPMQVLKYVFFPIITINTMQLAAPTTGSVLLALAQSMIVARDKRWATILADNVKPGKNPGVISLLKTDNPSGKPELVDLTSKAFSTDQRLEYILNNVIDNPVIQLDIPAFGYGTNAMSVLAIAADKTHEDSQAAREHIIEVANQITNGKFPLDFDPNALFQLDTIILPYGTFPDKDKTRKSIDEIDLMYVLDRKTNASIETQSSFVAAETGKAPDVVKIKVLDDISKNVAITGYKNRVIPNPQFLKTLWNAIAASGAEFTVDPSRVVAQATHSYAANQALYGAGLANVDLVQMNQNGRVAGPSGNFFGNYQRFHY